jgi:hypothetical protein
MRRLALAIALACVLSGVVHAGEIHSTGAVAEVPSTGMKTTGEIPTSDVAGEIGEIHTSAVITIILTLISVP